jgi:predicted ribosomally synthesized peptide with SipW-like signal peptide
VAAPRDGSRWRRIRALLAAGLVLSTGTVATLAAWTDHEHATATFAASGFEIESQTEGSDFASHGSPPGAVLAFAAEPMVPGRSVFAWMNLRTTAATTASGTLRLSSTDAEGALTVFLQYRAVRTEAALSAGQCEEATSALVGLALLLCGLVLLAPRRRRRGIGQAVLRVVVPPDGRDAGPAGR